MKEFGSYGYKDASTNRIYPEAGVSKGLIFKLFGSKPELFYQVFVRALLDMLEKLKLMEKTLSTDIYEKIIRIVMWKIEYAKKNPEATRVMLDAIGNPPEMIREKISGHMQELTKLSVRSFFADIPMENIRDEYTKDDVEKYLEIALQGLQAKYLDQNVSLEYMESIREESIKFIKTLIRGMEKNNGQRI